MEQEQEHLGTGYCMTSPNEDIDLTEEPEKKVRLPVGVSMIELNGRIIFVHRTVCGPQPVSDNLARQCFEIVKKHG